MSGILSSSIGRKFAMAISALFLMIFLLQHFAINILSVFSPDTFNEVSHFMGTFWVIQYALQPVLIFGVVFHFVMGFVLEIKNSKVLHFIDFWIPEINIKYIQGDMSGMHNGEFRYFHELVEKFHNPLRVGAYCLAFVFLALHLLHGFESAFQSVGANNKYTKGLKNFSKIYAIGIPAGFIFIALFHHLNQIL
jgi:succinate dehydrogenase / fumarate reductase cytochrome b subunit